MKNTFFILSFLIPVILLFSACSSDKANGILGIEVPVGSGKVTADTPYMISGVYEDTPAHKAGIKPGDQIVQINDMPVTNGMKFDEIFSQHLSGKPGTKVTIYVKRGMDNMIFEVVRAERGN